MAARTPAGQCVRLSHYGAEGVNPLVIEEVELVQFIISLVFVISFAASAVNPQTDTRNFLMTSFNVTVVWVCAIVECQVNTLGQQAGLGRVSLPSCIWQAKASFWLWSRCWPKRGLQMHIGVFRVAGQAYDKQAHLCNPYNASARLPWASTHLCNNQTNWVLINCVNSS